MEFEVEIEPSTRLVKIPVHVNSQGPFTFNLDTGASTTTLTVGLAEKLGIPTRDSARPDARGLGGGIPTLFADASISVGPLDFEQDEVYVLDFDKILGCGDRDGVLGYTTLKHCTMSLSYNKQRFKLSKGNSSPNLDWIPFDYVNESHLVGVPVHINGHGPYDFVLDTGAGNSCVTPSLAKKLGLQSQTVEGIARGVGGDVPLELAPADSIAVGESKITNTQLVVIDLERVSPKGKLIENGIIGYDFLRKFETVIDYPNKKLAFIDEQDS
ncbi:MAG: retropepsin-like aspartic protease [Candidatus Thorarchaeota archaeon]